MDTTLHIPGKPSRRTRCGMVVSVHHLASDAGLEILRARGNAVDAAVATAFALAVVHPIAGNIGGGGFLLLRQNDGSSTFIDFREKAPLAAKENMYLDTQGEVIPRASLIGYRSIATPGSVAGLVYSLRKYGRLPLERVIAPAMKLAAEGFALSAEEAKELTDPDLALFAESRRIFQRDGRLYEAGEVFRQPELARTLGRIAVEPEDFYHGAMARELVDELREGGALLTLEDLAQYKVVERAPIQGTYRDYTILSAPPPSSGGITLLSTLNILEGYDLSKLDDRSPAAIHLIVEAFRRAYKDRAEYLGDPDFNPMPVAELTAKDYAAAWRSNIRQNLATASASIMRPSGYLPSPPATGGRMRIESHNTTHLSVVDAEGNAVALTTTLNDNFGACVTAGRLGFLLNDEMDDFAAKLGVPNLYGLVQGPADVIEPGKRPLSAMTPTIVLKNDKLRFVLGSPGGSRISTTVANILLSAVEFGLDMQQAVDAPRFHHQYLPNTLSVEPGFPAETVSALLELGHDVSIESEPWSNGECIAIDLETGELLAGQDTRSSYGKAAS